MSERKGPLRDVVGCAAVPRPWPAPPAGAAARTPARPWEGGRRGQCELAACARHVRKKRGENGTQEPPFHVCCSL